MYCGGNKVQNDNYFGCSRLNRRVVLSLAYEKCRMYFQMSTSKCSFADVVVKMTIEFLMSYMIHQW